MFFKFYSNLLAICTNPKVNITERSTANPLGDAVFLCRAVKILRREEMLVIAMKSIFYGVFT